MSIIPNLGIITSEVVLSLYPILIKVVKTNFDTQLLSRFGVFTLASLFFYKNQPVNIFKSLVYGTLTIFHVVVSYIAFSNLSAGTAMSLFYTYPIMNVIAGVLFLKETISPISILFILLGFIGTVVLSYQLDEVKGEQPFKVPQNLAIWSGLAAAFTETLIFLIIRDTATSNPIDSILQLYPGALILFGLYLLLGKRISTIDTNITNWTKLGLFNLLIGFAGYCLRFYSINNVSTIIFSLLSFVGVLSSYLFGKYFVDESASWKTYVGAFLIALSASGIAFQ